MADSPGLLAIFAKHWQPGAVKTRLAPTIGHPSASRLYRAFVETLLERCRSLDAERQLWYSPPDRRAEFAAAAGDAWALHCQGDGDLGQRLRRFFDSPLRRQGRKGIVIGSDSPNVPLEYLRRAMHELSQSSVVLAPSDDGGYYLIGVAGPTPPIFEGISWSTPTVWRETVQRLTQLHLPFMQLPPWYDVDRVEDVQRLAADLAAESEPALVRLRQTVLEVLGSGSCEATIV